MNSAEAVFTNLVCIARADGDVERAEIDLLGRYREALGLDHRTARRIMSRRRLTPFSPDQIQELQSESLAHLRMLVRVASADGRVDRREDELIRRVAASLGVGPLQLADVKVTSGHHATTRRRVRVAKFVGVGVAVLAVVLAFWAADEGKREAERSEERMTDRLAHARVEIDAATGARIAEAGRRVEEARLRFRETESGLRERLEALADQVVRASERGSEIEEVRDRLGRLEGADVSDPGVRAEMLELRERIASWSAGEEERARTRAELERLRGIVDQVDGARRSFQAAISECGESVVILSVQYRLRRGKETRRRGSQGSGFFVTPDGLVVTNKHVVQPWKFKAEDRRLLDDGWELDPGGYFVTAWPAGTPVLDAERRYRFDLGYGIHNGKLKIAARAADAWEDRSVEDDEGREVEGRYHVIDERDLALLELVVEEPVPTLPLAADESELLPLDPVMVLGFPKGFGMLEGDLANIAPSLGRVRKLERSLWTTAPIVPGNSGGPIVDGRGRIVAVAYKGFRGADTLGAGIPIRHVLELLPPGAELMKRAEARLEREHWRAARMLARLAAQRDPALGERAAALEARVEDRRLVEVEELRTLERAGRDEDAERRRVEIAREFGSPSPR